MRLKLLVTSVFLMLAPISSRASLGDLPIDARSRSLGGAFTAMPSTPWAVFENPAGLGQAQNLEIGADYRKPYFVSDLHDMSAVLSRPLSSWGAGIGLRHKALGSLYSEDHLALGLGYSLLVAQVGANLRLLSVDASGYEGGEYGGRTTRATLDWGYLLRPFTFSAYSALVPLAFGYARFGLFEPSLSLLEDGEGDKVKTSRRFGLAYTWPEEVNWVVDLASDRGRFRNVPEHLRGGVETWFDRTYALRVGLEHHRLTGGIGVATRTLSLDFALASHRELGSTLALSVTWRPEAQ
jgi:hypothetical protein